MKHAPLKLPWTLETVPHAILDILRGCNIRCRDCYNLQPHRIKPLAEIEEQLDELMRLRQLQSVSIVGGEPTLHPDLTEIVRRVRQRGLFVELFTNGVGLNNDLLTRLKQAGVNVIFLHIEPHQRRPDLPEDATAEDLRRLRSRLVSLVAAHGIEVGLTVTAYSEKPEEVEVAIAFTLESPHVSYLLVTWWRDVSRMPAVTGDLTKGMSSNPGGFLKFASKREIQPPEMCQWLERRFGLTPFTFLGSNFDGTDPRWLSFMVGAVHRKNELVQHHSLLPTWVEHTFMEASRKLSGRYPFYQQQRAWQTGLHLVLNGLASGSIARNLKLVRHAIQPGGRLSAKRLLFQWPAAIDEQGRVVHCECCPDAVLKDGHLVPLCISDQIMTTQCAGKEKSTALAQT